MNEHEFSRINQKFGTMITIITDSGDVKFLNENEFIRIDFNKSDRKVVAHPIQRNAHIGMPYPIIEVSDVKSLAYTNEAQPTSFIFETKGFSC